MTAVIAMLARGLGRATLDLVLPPRCLSCGIPVAELGTLCGQCQPRPPRYDRARAVLFYDAALRDLAIDFKHGDRTDSTPTFGSWLHPAWLRVRRFNQSALMAAGLAKIAGLEWTADGLDRTRRTRSQGRRGGDERRRNVRGAFALTERDRSQVAGCKMVVIDDVLTTGATVADFAHPLQAGGADTVDVLTLARVNSPGRATPVMDILPDPGILGVYGQLGRRR